MALTAEKTWNFQQYIAQESTVDPTNRLMLWQIKDGMITGGGAWTVVSSSDSSSSGASDLWTTFANVVFNTPGNPHSWIVLQQTGIGTSFQICFDCSGAPALTENMGFVVSWNAGFTGGSTTARPTATDEYVLLSGTWASSANARYSTYVAKSSDGNCTRVYTFRDGVFFKIWFLDAPKSPESYWTQQWYGVVGKDPTMANFHNLGGLITNVSATPVDMFCATDGKVTSGGLQTLGTFQTPDGGGAWPACPITFFLNSATIRGMPGVPYDLWMVPSSLPMGDYLRGSGSPYDFVVLPPFLVPWTGNPILF